MNEYPYRVTEIMNKKRYPTYQFHGRTINDKLPADDVMSICILETMSWLRGRLSRQELPDEIDLPSPENYAEFDRSRLRSFTLSSGFTVEVVYLKNERVWAFCLTETDSGANIGTPRERLAVAGRSFETNIAFRADDGGVEVGVQTICSEPENTTADCEVFRPSIVKALYLNKNVGLRNILNITETPAEIETSKDIQRLKNAVDSGKNELPVILITTPRAAERPAVDMAAVSADIGGLKGGYPGAFQFGVNAIPTSNLSIGGMEKFSNSAFHLKQEKKPKKQPEKPKAVSQPTSAEPVKTVDSATIARRAASFAITCTVTDKMFDSVKKAFCNDLEHGDILILYQERAHEIISFADISKDIEKVQSELCGNISLYPKRRSVDFGNIVFTSDARIMELRARQQEKLSHGEETELLKAEIAELDKKLKRANEYVLDQKVNADEIRKKSKRIEELEYELSLAQSDSEARQAAYELQRKRSDSMTPALEFYREKSRQAAKFPIDRDDVPQWAEEFSDTLYLHKNAISGLKKYARPLDMQLLCDGLYYLHGYALYRRGRIDADMLKLFAEEYGWEVQPCGKEAMKMFPEDYSVSVEKNGKSVSRELDKHIKFGRNSQRWVRIYFFYDEDTGRVVVGSMPDHLRTVTDKT